MEQRVGRLIKRKEETMTVHSNDRLTGNTKLDRIGVRSRAFPNTMFNNLGHVIAEEFLHEAYHQLDGNKAIGVDGITKDIYGRRLNEHIKELIDKIRKGQYRPRQQKL